MQGRKGRKRMKKMQEAQDKVLIDNMSEPEDPILSFTAEERRP